ncbi:hypothetical protein T8K17_11220 [Thalassobaculum sp. OXR-137]|uniref:hypothetical protein n=1 Tax=Thalassobaculum sp. OXR-137 TaxID=3100173 RepID=UPI002AC98BCE|nr:hypothetical protein [Thalassobaculum sp. OXR-137]WPZ36705.1 hypothetical protein T8K17_11220 [Thalassobaculum sp. OXR-137]
MAYLVIEDFKRGQDDRKSKLTLPSGALVSLVNGYINRGGEVKKRKAFVSTYTLPEDATTGMASAGNALYVFGSSGAYATTSFEVTAGTLNAGTNRVTGITVDSIEILGVAVDWVESHAATATALAAQITAYVSTPNYTATADGAVVTLTASAIGTAANTLAVVVGVAGNVTTSTPDAMSGGIAAPVTPSGVDYIRMQHPTPATALSAVLFTDIFDGKVYSVGEFADASIHHFYDGVRVADWFDGRARGSFTVASGGAGAGTKSTTQFEITAGTSSAGTNKVTSVAVNGVEILGSAVDWVTSHSATATAVAAAITSYSSTPNYTAAAVGTIVTVSYPTVGSLPNGYTATVGVAGDVTTTAPPAMAGGVDASQITEITVNGEDVLGTAISYGATAAATAADIAAQIDTYSSTPEYTASAQGATVFILAAVDSGVAPNGYEIAVTTTGDVAVSGVSAFSGGESSEETFTPGESVRTVGTKMYSTSGSLMHFSGVNQPTKYTGDAIGSGFVNMSSQASGSETLVAIEEFFSYIAIFASKAIQIWSVFADDEQNRKVQVLKNQGCVARRSIVPYNDGEVVYLAESGVKSLRARDSTNVARVTDIGDAIDETVIAQMAAVTATQKERAFAVVEPSDNQLWMVIGTQIHVLSFYKESTIAAWSVFSPGLEFTDATVIGTKLYLRAGDAIYVYGGADGSDFGSDYMVTVELPFVNARRIATWKSWEAIDLAAEGTWDVDMALDVRNPDTYTDLANINGPTYSDLASGVAANATNIGLRLQHQAAGDATLSNIALHYEANEAG